MKEQGKSFFTEGNIGTSASYVNKIVRSKEQIMNKTFLAMMEDLGFDVELHYVERFTFSMP